MAKDLFKTAKFISDDKLWSDQIVQIYVNDNKDIELIPRIGDQKIIFGDGNLIEEKFRNLYIFYKKALPTVGWKTYSTINLKYKGQIVCERRDSTLINKKPLEIQKDSTTITQTELQDSI
jgi:cell division protein FtsQ